MLPPARCFILAALLLAFSPATRSAAQDFLSEPPAEKDRRMQWWREARFGMFIHWGLYAVAAGEYKGARSDGTGEWIQSWADIPRQEYEKLAGGFNPVRFDASRWVALARRAGMRYLVITSKHHDGFSMFHSGATEYDIVDATPYARDIMAALSRECRRQGIRLGFYYSIMDWHHPSQFVDAAGKHRTSGHGVNRIDAARKGEYVDYMKAQLEELIRRYDPALLWFDGEWVDWWTEGDGRDLYNYVRGLKPEIIINNRVGKGRMGMAGLNRGPGYAGDFGTPEQEIPETGLPGVDWESCMTMNDTWGYKHYDDNWKSSRTLIRNLIDAASKGGNYLLNVGPTASGEIPAQSVERLEAMGRWMRVNGESVHGAGSSPISRPEWGRVTRKGDRLYLHVFDWPEGALRLSVPEARRAWLLTAGGGPELKLERLKDGVLIHLPPRAPDPVATVVVVEQGPADQSFNRRIDPP